MLAMTSSPVLALRRLSRRLGLNGPIGRLLARAGYEHRFGEVMLSSVREGDRVWDVGANIGFYTTRFADIVGPAGQVIAFEPSPDNCNQLRRNTEGRSNVAIMPIGLGDSSRTEVLLQSPGKGGRSRVGGPRDTEGLQPVDIQIADGDSLIETGQILPPNLMKVDVEGMEVHVLRGLDRTLDFPGLRHLFLEIHFRLLDGRGQPGGSRDIVKFLRKRGFRLNWIFPSHIHAYRPD